MKARCRDAILDAFKIETPEVFGPNGITKDFKSSTVVLTDKVTSLAFDRRLAAISVRRIETVNPIVEELRIPKTMNFIQQSDPSTNLEITGVLWQEQGTGDSYFSAAILFGLGVGNQGLGAGAVTDYAGCVVCSQ